MPDHAPTIDRDLRVEVSPDCLTAWLHLGEGDGDAPLTPDRVLAALTHARIPTNDALLARVDELCASAARGEALPEKIEIARGTAPTEGKSEELIWDEPLRPTRPPVDDEARVDYYSLNTITTVDKDTVIGRIAELVPAASGTDVYGKVLPPPRQPSRLELADSVRRSPDNAAVVLSNVPGRVVYEGGRLAVTEILEFRGDIDFSSGHVDSHIDVRVRGTVRDRFRVRSRTSVWIGGAVELATVEVGKDVHIAGGVLGRQEGMVRAGGQIEAKFGDEAHLRAAGDIHITKALMNCWLHTDGTLHLERGAIIGGQVYAREGLRAATLGSEANVPTRIVVGVHPRLLLEEERTLQEIQRKRAAIDKIRNALRPLLAELKRLTPSQRELAAALLVRADETEVQIKTAEQNIEAMLARGRAVNVPRVLVSKIAHCGVTISIGARSATLRREIKGPVAIEKRKENNVTELVYVNQLTGSVSVLPNARVSADELLSGFDLLDEP